MNIEARSSGTAQPHGLADWVRIAQSQPLPEAPVLLSTFEGVIVRATPQAAALLEEEGRSGALIGRRLEDLGIREGPLHWFWGAGRTSVRAATWPHESDRRLRFTVLIDVSDLAIPSTHPSTGRANEQVELDRILDVSETPLLEVQRAARIGTWLWDPVANVVRFSQVLHELTGIPPQDELTYEDCAAYVYPEDLNKFRDMLVPLVEQHRPVEFEYRFVRPDGELRTFRGTGLASQEIEGRRWLVGTVQDVSAGPRRTAYAHLVDADYDPLTGLPQFRAAVDVLAELLDRSTAKDVAVLACGLDNLKRIGHSLGYEAGQHTRGHGQSPGERATRGVHGSTLDWRRKVLRHLSGHQRRRWPGIVGHAGGWAAADNSADSRPPR